MANVQVFQRHAHLAGSVKLEFVNGREGKVAKAVLTAISNTRRANRGGDGEAREEEATAIQRTLWGKQAENAAEYLGKGSHVNIIGRLRNNNFEKDGQTVYGMAFTAEEIDSARCKEKTGPCGPFSISTYRFAKVGARLRSPCKNAHWASGLRSGTRGRCVWWVLGGSFAP